MDVRREELISAYLDGELNTAEREEAEQLLAADADARALLEDLRGLRVKVRALPRYQLEPDFAQQVLLLATQVRAAGQEFAAESTEVPALSVSPQDTIGADAQPEPPPYERDLRRPLIWAGLAIAAALLVMLYGGPQPETTVAHKAVDRTADDAAAMSAPTGQPEAESRDLQMSAAPADAVDAASNGIFEEGSATEPPTPSVEMAKALAQEQPADGATVLAKSAAREKAVDLGEADVDAVTAPDVDLAARTENVRRAVRQRKVGDTEVLAQLRNDGTAVFQLAAAAPMNKRELNRQLENRLKSVKQRQSLPTPADEFQQDKLADARANRARASVMLQKTQATEAGLELVYAVEGTRQQIAAALSELQAQPNALQLVAVAPRVAANYGEALHGNYRVHQELSDGVLPAVRDMADALAADSVAPLAAEGDAGQDHKAMRRSGQSAAGGDASALPHGGAGEGGGAGGGAGDGTSFAQRSAATKRKDGLRPVDVQAQQAGSEASGGERPDTADGQRGRPALRSEAADSTPRAPGAAEEAPTASEQKAAAFGGAEPTAPKQAAVPRPLVDDRAPAEAEAEELQVRESLHRVLLVIRLSPDASSVPAAASALKKSLDTDAASEAVEPDGGSPAGASKGSK